VVARSLSGATAAVELSNIQLRFVNDELFFQDGFEAATSNPATPTQYTLGGSLSGLAAGQIVTMNNAVTGESLTRATDGAFVFAQSQASGSQYNVTVSQQPSGQTCLVSGGNGAINGGSVSSILVNCTSSATIPGAPLSIAATAGNAQNSLSWSAPAANGGSAITSYRVFRGTTTTNQQLVASGGCANLAAVTSCTDAGLSNGQIYYYTVNAINLIGQGAASNQVSATPISAGPQLLLNENFDGASFLGALWTPVGPASVSGGIARFACGASANTIGKFSFSGDLIVIEAKFVGPGSLRDTRIGLIDASNSANQIFVGDTNYNSFGLYTAGTGIFNLAHGWNGTSRNQYQEYRITISGTSLIAERGDTLANLTETRSVTLAQSTTGKAFFLDIGTGNPDYCPGEFDWIRVIGSPSLATIPGSPLSLAVSAGNAQSSLSWSAPASNGGSAITSYRVFRGTTTANQQLVTSGGCASLAAVTSCTDAGLTNGQVYFYTVNAVNVIGHGPASNQVSATPVNPTLIYDDFTTSTIDTAKWGTNLYVSQPNSSQWDGSTTYKQIGRGGVTRVPLKTVNGYSISTGLVFEWRGTVGATSVSSHFYQVSNAAGTESVRFGDDFLHNSPATAIWSLRSGSTVWLQAGEANTYYTFKIEIDPNGTVRWFVDGALHRTEADVFSGGSTVYWETPNNHDSGSVSYLDWIRITRTTTP